MVSIYLSIYLSIRLSVVRPYVRPSVRTSVFSVCPTIHSSVRPGAHTNDYLLSTLKKDRIFLATFLTCKISKKNPNVRTASVHPSINMFNHPNTQPYLGAKRLGGNGNGGETTRVWGAKRLGLKIEAKRLGGKRLGGKRFMGKTSCYRRNYASV